MNRLFLIVLFLLMTMPAIAAAEDPASPSQHSEPYFVLDKKRQQSLETAIPTLAEKRVIYIGETHDRYDHHLNQLAVIRRLHERSPQWAIGLEFFQQPFQEHLDAYVAGEIDERTLLEKTEYFQRWRYDYRLYRPILQYAAEHGIPLVALNVPGEITRKVAQEGINGLDDEERRWVPDTIDKSNQVYRQRLQQIFEEHEGFEHRNFEYFLEAQLLWDEAMAARAAGYLADNPDRSMVILAGSGHLAHGSGIPDRLQRRIAADTAILLQQEDEEQNLAELGTDYGLLTTELSLPPSGRIGVMLHSAEEKAAGMHVQSVLSDSAAEAAGIKSDDLIVAIDDQPIHSMQDVRLVMLDKQPGESVNVTIERDDQKALTLAIVLR